MDITIVYLQHKVGNPGISSNSKADIYAGKKEGKWRNGEIR